MMSSKIYTVIFLVVLALCRFCAANASIYLSCMNFRPSPECLGVPCWKDTGWCYPPGVPPIPIDAKVINARMVGTCQLVTYAASCLSLTWIACNDIYAYHSNEMEHCATLICQTSDYVPSDGECN